MTVRRRRRIVVKAIISTGLAVVAVSQIFPVPVEIVSVANLVVGLVWVWKV